MFQHYLKTAFRNLFRNKALSLMNIGGLSLGMAGAILLLLNIQYNLGYDQFHEKKSELYQVKMKGNSGGRIRVSSSAPEPLGPDLQRSFAEVKRTARVIDNGKLVTYGDKKIYASGYLSDTAFLQMFSFPLVSGSFQGKGGMVITETFAQKIFGTEPALGKILQLDNKEDIMVTGIVKALPDNTKFRFDYLLPITHPGESWKHYNSVLYAELQPHVNVAALNHKVKDLIRQHGHNTDTEIFLYPFHKLHLFGKFENGQPAGGNIRNIYFMGGLALAMLLIACINFMNLGTARSERRAREVGVRKVAGASKQVLVLQFIGESIVLAAIAGIIAILLVQLALPAFGRMSGSTMSISWQSPSFWMGIIGFVMLTGVLAGAYPAFYLSAFKPASVLKGVMKGGPALVTPRKILVVLQFAFAIFLINFTIVIQKQIKHEMGRETGFEKDLLVFHPLNEDLRQRYAVIKQELLAAGIASAVSQSNTTILHGGMGVSGLKWDGMNPADNVPFNLLTSSSDFVKTNGLTLLAGRDVDIVRYPADTLALLVNEAAVKALGFPEPVGRVIIDDTLQWKIVGVVKDVLMGSPTSAISPMLIRGGTWSNYINIRLTDAGKTAQAENVLRKFSPRYPVSLQYADAMYASKFQEAKSVSTLINTFTILAIFISCMGLYALANYTAESRTKEIGIRKVLGATVTGITGLLVKDFARLVLIAVLVVSPLAWTFMHFFLQRFHYRTELNSWILLIAGGMAMFIALLTVSTQSVKAALANPGRSLRTE